MAVPPVLSDREWLLTHLESAISELPDPLPLPERLIVAGAIVHLTLTPDRIALSEVLDVFNLLARRRGEPPKPVRDLSHNGARRALDFIGAQYADARLTLGDVARAVGLSQYHLAHLLKRHTGRAFLWHLHTARLQASTRLLGTTSFSVKEIAARVGYNDSTQLCRHFRRRTGLSPLTYRTLVDTRRDKSLRS
jgi:AraC-like DNA-binding protein